MSEMVERVARAMSECEPNDTTRRIARRAIEAMREPTDYMMSNSHSYGHLEAYQSMIDAALK